MYKAAIYIPFFPGFYETWLEPDYDRIEEYLREDLLDIVEYPIRDLDRFESAIEDTDCWDHFENEDYQVCVAKMYVEQLTEFAQKRGTILEKVSFEYESIHRPRYYNYENDEIAGYVYVPFDDMIKYMDENSHELEEYLRENHCSYDGFCSFVPTDYEAFRKETLSDDKKTVDRNIGILVEFAITKELHTTAKDIREDIIEFILENVYEPDFCDRDGFAREVVRHYRGL